MPVSVKKTSNLPQLSAAIAKLGKARVLVGIPEARASRKGDEINNAQLLFIFTNGSPMRGIPARPVLQPAIKDPTNKAVITKQLAAAAQGAFAANEQQLRNGLGGAGTAASNAARQWFTSPKNGWPPNSAATIAAKGSSTPGIDTGQLRRAITYIVDEDGTASAVETVT